MLPLDPKLSFTERLKLIQSRVNYSKSINENLYTYLLIKYFWSIIPKSLLRYFYVKGSKVMPMIISGVREYQSNEWKLFGRMKLLSIGGGVPLSPGIPIAFGFITVPNSDLICLHCTMDIGVYGQNGADLMVESLQTVLNKYGVPTEDQSKQARSNL